MIPIDSHSRYSILNCLTESSSRHYILRMVIGVAALLTGSMALAKADKECTSPSEGAPMFITDDCVDPVLNDPYIDTDEMRTTPVPHRFVHGGFNGTDAKFSLGPVRMRWWQYESAII